MDDVKKWKAIYRLLNRVEVEAYDCGALCGNICCTCESEKMNLGIYLFPGEHLLLEEMGDTSWLEIELQDPRELGFPRSWKDPVYFVNCKTPPVCRREWRPLQCRTFPLKPVFGENGVLEMIWENDVLPYKCPIIEQNAPIRDDFYKATYTVWSHLARDPRFFDLIMQQSN